MNKLTDIWGSIQDYTDMGLDKMELYDSAIEEVFKDASNLTALEIGVRKGGFSSYLMQKGVFKRVFAVDPYGGKIYYDEYGNEHINHYTDEMYRDMLIYCSQVAKNTDTFWYFFKTTSIDFLNTMYSVEFCNDVEPVLLGHINFDFVLLDGDHRKSTVLKEIELLNGRINKGGVVMIDNIDWWRDGLDETPIEEYKRKDVGIIYC